LSGTPERTAWAQVAADKPLALVAIIGRMSALPSNYGHARHERVRSQGKVIVLN